MRKRPTGIHMELLKEIVPIMKAAWQVSGLTQQGFADAIRIHRTPVSHLVNCFEPGTKHPEYPSVKKLDALKNNDVLASYVAAARQAGFLPREVDMGSSSSRREAARRAARPRVRDLWEYGSLRRSKKISVVAIHTSRNPRRATVTIKDVSTGRVTTHNYGQFMRRYRRA